MKESNSTGRLIIAALAGGLIVLGVMRLMRPAETTTESVPQTAAVESATPSTAEPDATTNEPPAEVATTSTDTSTSTNAPGSAPPNDVTVAPQPPPGAVPGSTPVPPDAAAEASSGDALDEEIQLSFQGANIDMIVQWLAKTSGKSVVKHPRVNCQLTIVNSRKMPVREAMNLVYSALALEGFSVVETGGSILIVPNGQEPTMSPEFVQSGDAELPEGRQRILKVFDLQHSSASALKDRVKTFLSEKANVEVDERANKLLVTDYTDNIRLLAELLPEIDATSSSETTIRLYPLKHLEAQEMANLLNLIMSGGGGGATAQPSGSSMSSLPPGMPPGMVMNVISSRRTQSPTVPASGDIRFWPDHTANRLIVSAPLVELPRIEELIESLDTEKPADVTVRTLPLKHVSATDLMREIAPLYQRMSGQSLKDVIEVAANERSNSLIVLSSDSNFRALRAFVQGLDNEDAQRKVMRTFVLKNADAEEVAEQLKELGDDSTGTSRYNYVYVYSARPTNQPEKTRVVADRRRNTVIVQAAPSDMEGIAEMIKALDEPVPDNALAPRIFPLNYVNALDIEEVLNELFLKQEEQRDYWSVYYGTGEQSDAQDVGRLYGKVRITSERYSNSIIVTANSEENLRAVQAILEELDQPSQAGDSTLRVGLKFADAIKVANSLNILFARGGAPPLAGVQPPQGQPDNRNQQPNTANTTQDSFQLEREEDEQTYFPWLGGQPDTASETERPASDLIGRVRVVPDKRSNSIMLTANVHYFPQVLKLINELDTPTAQVLIETKIIEVSSDFRDRFGVRWSPDGDQVFDAEDMDGSIAPSLAAAYRRVFSGTEQEGSLRSGVLEAGLNLDILIQFLRKNAGGTVLAEPQINVADNELGRLFVGAQVPFISSSLNTDVGGRNDSFQYKNVGIILEVTPQVNSEDEVAMKIRTESSNIRNGETLFGGAILDTRNFRTDLLVKTGETIVLGGIKQSQQSDVVRKVPLLGDVPVLGWLFKKKDTVTRDVELMVFLRPRIARSPEDAARLLRDVEAEMPALRDWRTPQVEAQ